MILKNIKIKNFRQYQDQDIVISGTDKSKKFHNNTRYEWSRKK